MKQRRVARSSPQRREEDLAIAQSGQNAPPYACPGCFKELTDTGTLNHFNACTALREAIAYGDTIQFAWNPAFYVKQTQPMQLGPESQDSQKRAQPRNDLIPQHGIVSDGVNITDLHEKDWSTPAKQTVSKLRGPRQFRPHRMLDTVIKTLSLENDAALATRLNVSRTFISRIRQGTIPIGSGILMRLHQASDIPISQLHALISNTAPNAESAPNMGMMARSRRTRPSRPHLLLDTLLETLSLPNDSALAQRLDVTAPVISKLRSGKLPLRSSILLRMHEASNIPISLLRALMGKDAPGTKA